jgi:uncharacterized protein (TIGR03435 family)
MFERYTERARRVLFFARYEADRLGGLAIETEHLLLGLLREGKGITSRIFAASPGSLEQIRKRVDGGAPIAEPVVAADPPEIPFSAETKRVLLLAAEEADRLLHNHIGTEHLLLGLLREERSRAASILIEHGFRLATVRDDIVILLQQEETLPPFPGGKPDRPPSYEVHISPTTRREEEGTVSREAHDYWMRLGEELKPIIAELYGVDETRIDVPAALDLRSRYDFVVVLPRPESRHTTEHLVQQAIEKHFRLVITRETRAMDVIVVTAPDGVKATRLLEEAGGGMMGSFREFQVDTRVRPLPAMRELMRQAFSRGECGVFGSGTTVADFCKGLEHNLGRLFVDETGLTGIYDQLELRGNAERFEDVLQALRDQVGLVATPDRRDVMMLVVRQT